ncbi:SBBP repeat-containing protein [Hymenobacter algoricola]|uniref:SBBP repeat-containing protein n=1 Tax=Hymenobacter algoricola TaxID=486267 RepID=UPI0031EDEFEC
MLLGICAAWSAQAQSGSPAWTSAQSVSTTSLPAVGTAVDATGNTYTAGRFTGTASFGGTAYTSQGGGDAYLAKYTPAGALAWVRILGGPGSESANDLALDAAGNAYITGDFSATVTLGNNLVLNGGTPGIKAFVVRFSPLGMPEWALHSADFSSGTSLAIDANDNVYVAGTFGPNLTLGGASITIPGAYERYAPFLARLSAATGQLSRLTPAFFYAPNGTTTATYSPPEVAVSPAGAAYLINAFVESPVVGPATFTSRGLTDALVLCLNEQGTVQWARQIGGTNNEYINDGIVDAAGNFYVTGYFAGQAFADALALPNAGGFDGFLVKFSPQGDALWARNAGGPAFDSLYGLALDQAGQPYVTGNFSGTAQFGPTTLTAAGATDICVVAYTAQGQVRWAQQAGGTAIDTGHGIGLNAGGDIYLSGTLRGPATFGSYLVPVAAPVECFLARLDATLPTATKGPQPRALGPYPNPATDLVYLPALAAGTRVELIDAWGRLVRETLVSATAQVSVRGLAPGLYTLRAPDAQGRPFAGKVVVE